MRINDVVRVSADGVYTVEAIVNDTVVVTQNHETYSFQIDDVTVVAPYPGITVGDKVTDDSGRVSTVLCICGSELFCVFDNGRCITYGYSDVLAVHKYSTGDKVVSKNGVHYTVYGVFNDRVFCGNDRVESITLHCDDLSLAPVHNVGDIVFKEALRLKITKVGSNLLDCVDDDGNRVIMRVCDVHISECHLSHECDA